MTMMIIIIAGAIVRLRDLENGMKMDAPSNGIQQAFGNATIAAAAAVGMMMVAGGAFLVAIAHAANEVESREGPGNVQEQEQTQHRTKDPDGPLLRFFIGSRA